MRVHVLLAVGFVTSLILGCGSNPDQVKLQGSGASFPALLYDQWFKDYKKENGNVTVEYQSTGSGAGVKSVIDNTVDFGASDAAMTKDEMAKVERGVVLLPMTAGKVVLVYNVEGVDNLKLSRTTYVNIFLGKITRWDDPAIVNDNKGVNLPNKPINVVTRADSSGTSYVFSQHLSAINEDFKKSPGTNKAPNWPVGTKAQGNEGVTSSVKTNPGSIGYVEYGYAKSTGLKMAALQNKEGVFVVPSIASGQAALASVPMPEDLIAWIPDPAGKESYPIVTYTWLICYKRYDDPKKAEALKKVIRYCMDKGQAVSEELGYIPLPAPVVEKVKAALSQIGG